MHDLIAFLRARWNEAEKIARAACEGTWGHWDLYDDFKGVTHVTVRHVRPDFINLGAADWPGVQDRGRHIVENDPAYVLADIAAKRQILDLCEAEIQGGTDGAVTAASVLHLLALPYAADHPDFDPA